jgi:NADPH-dependent glutamate synthase beta subunit-like oxidoreductase
VAAFDLNAAAARQMVNRTVAETDGTSLIIGFGKLGQAVATELLRLGFRRDTVPSWASRSVLAVDRRAEMKAAELRRRCGVQTAAQMRGIVVEFDYDDLAAVAGDAGARITSVFVCVNDDAMNVALGHEAAQSFPGVTVSVRMSSLTSGIGLLMTKQPDTPRIRFVGFHDEAKNVDVLRDAEGRLSQDDSA